MAGLEVTSCAHDNPNTKQNVVLSDVLSLYLYNFQNNKEQCFQLTCCILQRKFFVFWNIMEYCLSLQSIQMNIKTEDLFAGQYSCLLFPSCFPDVDFLQNTIKCIFWDFDKVQNFISVLALHPDRSLRFHERETVMEYWPFSLQSIRWIAVLANKPECKWI